MESIALFIVLLCKVFYDKIFQIRQKPCIELVTFIYGETEVLSWCAVCSVTRQLLIGQIEPGSRPMFSLDVAFSHLFGNSSNIYLILGSVLVMDKRDKVSIASNPLV